MSVILIVKRGIRCVGMFFACYNLCSLFFVRSLRFRISFTSSDTNCLSFATFYSYYETIQVLGVGSMGSVTKVKKRENVIGGSARQSYVNSVHGIEGFCFSLPIIGHLLRHCTGKDLGHRVKRDLFVTSPSSVNSERDISSASSPSSSSSSSSSNGRSLLRSPSSTLSYAKKDLYFALKTIHFDRVTDQQLVLELQNEIDILKSMDHPNIVRALETYDYRNNSCIVLELCEGGDLYTRDPYTEEDALSIVASLLSAVEYMHSRNICHRDLKYENIMFSSRHPKSDVKLIDFGLSKKYLPSDRLSEGVGTIYSMAPEVPRTEHDVIAI